MLNSAVDHSQTLSEDSAGYQTAVAMGLKWKYPA